MIGSSDMATKTFIPPIFNKYDFEKIINLQRSEMNNKLLFYKCMRRSYQNEIDMIKDLLPEEILKSEEVDQEKAKNRTFTLKKHRRSSSLTNSHLNELSDSKRLCKEVKYEGIEDKIYRKTTFCDYNIASLENSLQNMKGEGIEEEFGKAFSIKQFADVIESITAAIFMKTGLHGSQLFLKSLGLLDVK